MSIEHLFRREVHIVGPLCGSESGRMNHGAHSEHGEIVPCERVSVNVVISVVIHRSETGSAHVLLHALGQCGGRQLWPSY